MPPVGQCIEDGKAPPTRILVTKDGKAAFVETQTSRSDAEHSYSYTFLSSPLPVSNYTSTIKVTAKPLIGPESNWTKMSAAMIVVILESTIALKAFL